MFSCDLYHMYTICKMTDALKLINNVEMQQMNTKFKTLVSPSFPGAYVNLQFICISTNRPVLIR